jgi:hypothetical protein
MKFPDIPAAFLSFALSQCRATVGHRFSDQPTIAGQRDSVRNPPKTPVFAAFTAESTNCDNGKSRIAKAVSSHRTQK